MPSVKTVTINGKDWPAPGLGLMSIGSVYGPTESSESKALLRKALDIGNTFWDTADVYGCGLSETLIGQVLKETGKRDQIFLATKFGIEWDRNKKELLNQGRGDAQYIRQCVKESLERLGTVPDLLYQHRQDQSGNVDIEEVYRVLGELQKEGKVKALGVSEASPETLKRILQVANISALQIEYSPFERDIETVRACVCLMLNRLERFAKNGLLDVCKENGIVIVAYAPIGRGFLSGKYKNHEDVKNRQASFPRFSQENFDRNNVLVQRLTDFANRKGCTPAQLCIAWVSAQGDNIIPIPGTSKIKNMEENFAAREVVFTPEELKELRDVIDSHQVSGSRYPMGMAKMLDKGMK